MTYCIDAVVDTVEAACGQTPSDAVPKDPDG